MIMQDSAINDNVPLDLYGAYRKQSQSSMAYTQPKKYGTGLDKQANAVQQEVHHGGDAGTEYTNTQYIHA